MDMLMLDGNVGPELLGVAKLRAIIDALIEARSATASREPAETAVEEASQVIADSPLIDAPKLSAPHWMGLARAVLNCWRPKPPPVIGPHEPPRPPNHFPIA